MRKITKNHEVLCHRLGADFNSANTSLGASVLSGMQMAHVWGRGGATAAPTAAPTPTPAPPAYQAPAYQAPSSSSSSGKGSASSSVSRSPLGTSINGSVEWNVGDNTTFSATASYNFNTGQYSVGAGLTVRF